MAFFKNTDNSCAVDCLMELYHFGFANRVSREEGQNLGKLNSLLLQASNKRQNADPKELPAIRAPVWTWLANHVQSFKNVGSTDAAIADCWAYMAETEADKGLFAVRFHGALVCPSCHACTPVQQAHSPLLLSLPNLQNAGMDATSAVALQIADLTGEAKRMARCQNCGHRGLQDSEEGLLLELPSFLVIQFPLVFQGGQQPQIVAGIDVGNEMEQFEEVYSIIGAIQCKDDHFTVVVKNSGDFLFINDIGPTCDRLSVFNCRSGDGYGIVIFQKHEEKASTCPTTALPQSSTTLDTPPRKTGELLFAIDVYVLLILLLLLLRLLFFGKGATVTTCAMVTSPNYD